VLHLALNMLLLLVHDLRMVPIHLLALLLVLLLLLLLGVTIAAVAAASAAGVCCVVLAWGTRVVVTIHKHGLVLQVIKQQTAAAR
jgi:hypothetical protein